MRISNLAALPTMQSGRTAASTQVVTTSRAIAPSNAPTSKAVRAQEAAASTASRTSASQADVIKAAARQAQLELRAASTRDTSFTTTIELEAARQRTAAAAEKAAAEAQARAEAAQAAQLTRTATSTTGVPDATTTMTEFTGPKTGSPGGSGGGGGGGGGVAGPSKTAGPLMTETASGMAPSAGHDSTVPPVVKYGGLALGLGAAFLLYRRFKKS